MVDFTICADCGHRVHTAPGFCSVCGVVFPLPTLSRQVAATEREGQDSTAILPRIPARVTVTFLPQWLKAAA